MKVVEKPRSLQPVVLRVSPIIVLSVAVGLWIGACFQTPATPPLTLAHAEEAVGDPAIIESMPTVTLPDFATLAEAAMPAVVAIQVFREISPQNDPHNGPRLPEQLRPFFPWLFEQQPHLQKPRNKAPEKKRLVPTSAGSGFLISEDGYIVTNHHVVNGGEKVEVQIGEEETYIATIVGSDEKVDLAVLKIKADRSFTTLSFGDVDKVRIGEWVLAIGNPFRLKHTVTAGIVSAKERNINRGSYDNYIQTDASINPGNSGGPLLNMKGEVIGVNTAIVTRTGESAGIGLAIPADMVKNIVDQLRTTGKVERGWLGVQIQKVTPKIATGLGLETPRGALISMVTKGSPAEDAELETGDVIVSVDGERVGDFHELPIKVSQMTPGTKVKLVLIRDGKNVNRTVKLGRMPSDGDLVQQMSDSEDSETLLGMTVRDVTVADLEEYDVKTPKGALVQEVQTSSPAEYGGVRAGDVIRSLKYEGVSVDIATVAEMHKHVNKALDKKAEVLVLVVSRDGQRMLLALDLEER